MSEEEAEQMSEEEAEHQAAEEQPVARTADEAKEVRLLVVVQVVLLHI